MSEQRRDLWIGTYPVAGAGTPSGLGEGIWRVRLDADSGTLGDPVQVVSSPAPSFLALDPTGRLLLAVGEAAPGTVSAFRVDQGGLVRAGTLPSGGDDPCHLLVDPAGRAVYVANYSSGTLGVLALGSDGLQGDGPVQVLAGAGSGPVAGRQDGPHAHVVAPAPGGEHLLVCDLGTDTIRRYRRGEDGLLTEDGTAATLPAGSGPRHLTFSADGRTAYVACELDVTVAVLAWDRRTATGTLIQQVPAVEEGAQAPREALPSHLERVGDRVLVATRGPDVLATFAAGPDSTLTPAGQIRLPGAWPRHFAVVDRLVVVADQKGSTLTVLRDGEVLSRTEVPSPACVLPA